MGVTIRHISGVDRESKRCFYIFLLRDYSNHHVGSNRDALPF